MQWRIASWAIGARLAVVSDAGKEIIAQEIKARDTLIERFVNIKHAMGVGLDRINTDVEKMKKVKSLESQAGNRYLKALG